MVGPSIISVRRSLQGSRVTTGAGRTQQSTRLRAGVRLGTTCVYLGRCLCLHPREVRECSEKLSFSLFSWSCLRLAGLAASRVALERQQERRERAEEAEANKQAEVAAMS
jgi:hypothetical protein